jgi:hypothetical protein
MMERTTFWGVFLVSIGFSFGWLFFCVLRCQSPIDAGRGGAIGTAIALFALFVTRDYGMKLYTALADILPDVKARMARLGAPTGAPAQKNPPTTAELEQRIDTLVAAIKIEGKGHKLESICLASATFVGTIVTAFGDVFASHLIEYFHHCSR